MSAKKPYTLRREAEQRLALRLCNEHKTRSQIAELMGKTKEQVLVLIALGKRQSEAPNNP